METEISADLWAGDVRLGKGGLYFFYFIYIVRILCLPMTGRWIVLLRDTAYTRRCSVSSDVAEMCSCMLLLLLLLATQKPVQTRPLARPAVIRFDRRQS